MPTVLVVDDDPHIREVIGFALQKSGFTTVEAENGEQALIRFREACPDLVVLDIVMPELDGTEVCKALRRASAVPIVFLSSRDDEVDRILGLELGGDDYVTKPFSLDEILARVRALLRRSGRAAVPSATPLLRAADLELDPDRHEVRRAGYPVELTPTEFNLLRLFMENPNRVLTKQVILDRVWQYAFTGDAAIVESYMSYLRRKLTTAPGQPRLLETVRGVGYVLKVP